MELYKFMKKKDKKMKHFYKDEKFGEDWFSYADFYKKVVELLPKDKKSTIVEVGCWKGKSTSYMGVEIINSGKDIDFYAVDAWKYIPTTEQPVSNQEMFDNVYKLFLENIKPIENNIKIIKDNSIEASKKFKNNSIDFIFIDASHKYEDVLKDLNAWFPKLKENGMISGHDYFTRVHPGVKKAVDEFFDNNIETFYNENVWCSGYDI